LNQADTIGSSSDRRTRIDRRKNTLRSLIHGSFSPRRRGSRRDAEHSFTSVDWHHPQWLAVAILTLLLCTADAFLTLVLLERGATEANPFMQPLVGGSPFVFAMVKMGLTSGGIVVLILLARVKVFGRIPVSVLLYGVLFAYAALVGYESWLLSTLFQGPLI
jgi:ABC-type amino acid transport system permease subunit